MVIESEVSVTWDTKKNKCYQQEILTYHQFNERRKTGIYFLADVVYQRSLTNKIELDLLLMTQNLKNTR